MRTIMTAESNLATASSTKPDLAVEKMDRSAAGSRGPWPSCVVNVEKEPLARALLRRMMRTVDEWGLIKPHDRIMVALSGGKDSSTLFDLFVRVQERAPFPFEVIGVHLDQVQPGYDGSQFYQWLENFGAPFEIVREDTYSVVKEKTKEGQAYCFICSRLRRGILYRVAERLDCNVIALGHHRNDTLETFFMNLFFAGKMQAMPAQYQTDDNRFRVIRPLIDIDENDIEEFAKAQHYPIIPCNLCGNQEGLRREEMRDLLARLEEKIPDVRNVMGAALKNVRPSHLLDQELVEVWTNRDPDIRPSRGMAPGNPEAPWRDQAKTVLKGGQFPILRS